MSISLALRIAALICFILACLIHTYPLIPAGLALWVASTLP